MAAMAFVIFQVGQGNEATVQTSPLCVKTLSQSQITRPEARGGMLSALHYELSRQHVQYTNID